MGKYLFDKYSLLHFISGYIMYYTKLSFIDNFILHILFEYIENTSYDMFFINNYLTFWPGGKNKKDTLLNNIGDQTFFIFGWLFAKHLNTVSKK